jgi:hypothetical protein
MAVTAQGRAQPRALRWRCLREQLGQVGRLVTVGRLRDDFGGDRAYPRQGP